MKRTVKSIIAGLTACTLLLSMGIGEVLPLKQAADMPTITAHAAESHIWDGTADTSWYYREHQYVITGEGDTAKRIDIFCISTPEELAGLAKLVRNGVTMKDTYINLMADIQLNDLSNYENWTKGGDNVPAYNWTAIGMKKNATPYDSDCGGAMGTDFAHNTFEGYFNGNGHTISGMFSYHYSVAGLFGYVSGVVANTVVKDSFVIAQNPSRDDDSSSWPVYAGGIAAYCDRGGVITCCEFDGSVMAQGRYYENNIAREMAYPLSHECSAGGIVGRVDDGSPAAILGMIMYTCIFGIQVYGIPTTPLIIGSYNEGKPIMGVFNCINRGDVSSDWGKSALGAGGIVGTGGLLGNNHGIDTYAIYHCLSEGTISRNDKNYGAMVGNHDSDSYSCNNYKEIGCYYTNCDNSSFKNEAINYTDAGMSKEEVAEQLGDVFKVEDGEIRLDFTQTTETVEPSEIGTDTFAMPQETPGTLPAPDLNKEVSGNAVQITWSKDESLPAWEYQVAADPDFTDIYCTGSSYVSMYMSEHKVTIENLNLDRSYYIRVRGRNEKIVTDSTQYTEWSYLTAGTIPVEEPEVVPGEVNGDNTVNASDAATILIAAAAMGAGGEAALTDAQKSAADVNKDNVVNASDAAIVLIYSAAVGAGYTDAKIIDFVG